MRRLATERQKAIALDAFLIAVVLAIAAFAVASSWLCWLDPIIDAGRDLYVSERIAHGAKLYRDLAYIFPPLAPYLLAAIVAVTGSSLAVFATIGASIALLTMGAIYATGRLAGSRAAATAAAALFAACSLIRPNGYNQKYLSPYSHAAVLGMLFFVATVAFFAAYLYRSRRSAFLAAAFACALAAIWTKLEYATFAIAVVLFMAVVHRIDWRWLAGFAAAFALSIAGVFACFADAPTSRFWLRGHLGPPEMFASPAFRVFYATVSGIDRWRPALLFSLAGAALYVSIVLLFRAGERTHRAFTVAGLVFAALLASTAMFFAAWTVLQIAAIPLAIRRRREPIALLLLASLCATSRIPFAVMPHWYGFVLMTPIYLLIAYVLFVQLPREGVYSERTALLWLVPIAIVIVQSLVEVKRFYGGDWARIDTPRGTFFTHDADRAAAVRELGAALERRGVRSLVVIPEGVTINYLFEIDTPLAYYSFIPLEAADPRAESAILDQFDHKKPEWVVLATQDFTEMGSRGFGVDYCRHLAGYLRANYALAERIQKPTYSMLLLRRR